MQTLKSGLPWPIFSELQEKYPQRVLQDIQEGNFHFSDDAVFMHLPAEALDRYKATS